jgi:hypothetical protein
MRTVYRLSAFLFAATLAVVTFTTGTASAVPCCSAPICQSGDPPPICNICSDCASDDASAEEVVADEYEDDVCWLGEE